MEAFRQSAHAVARRFFNLQSDKPARRWRRSTVLLLALQCAGAATAFAPPHAALEPESKAAYILNFARYTTWPGNAFRREDTPLVFGVLAAPDDPVAEALERLLHDHLVHRRPARFLRLTSAGAATHCHVVFLAETAHARVDDLLEAVRERPILTVSDVHPFATRGGMLGLVTHQERLHFEANPQAARAAGLRLSSRLLNLAVAVVPAAP